MSIEDKPVALITGASSGMGKDFALRLISAGYIVYGAKTDPCGNWSQNAADMAQNLPMPDFGCSNQHNLAAMISEPRDLMTPRGMTPADATRRGTVINTYEKAQSTASAKSQDQNANLSSVGSGQ